MALLIGSPFLGNGVLSRVAVALLLHPAVCNGVAASKAPHLRWIAATLATVSGVVIFAGLFLEHRVIYLPVVALLTIYLGYTIGVVLRRMVIGESGRKTFFTGHAPFPIRLGL